MEPWYRIVTPRPEVRAGRSFNPDEFAIALEQVVAGMAPEDYRDPAQFFARTCWTRALRDHCAMVLRRLAGHTDQTAPVLTLITQFGGGKTHTLTALYHLCTAGQRADAFPGVAEARAAAGLSSIPAARVAVFVGNAWDPQEGRETPWIDIARQLAGDAGVAALGPAARTTPPGTDALTRLFAMVGAPVLILFDEVLNFLNRHRSMADAFHAFLQNLTVAATGVTRSVAVISLPRSQVEMTEWDMEWQEKITKVVRRVARDLIVNDESEISEVVRRRLFEDLGAERVRKNVTRAFADWCFERRAQLPPEWTAVDTAVTEAKARDYLRARFEACYPFHPATLSVFQRKWQALPQYQQTRGTLAMLAQWIAWAYRDGFQSARREPLITLGSAPLHDAGFRSAILGQLGESRLIAAIEADIAGDHAHARALDANTSGPLRDIHRRVGATILFESSGGQTDKAAHLPELRFALGAPDLDTTTIDTAAFALEERAYFIRRVGTDGFRIGYRPTLRKIVNDRRASLDEEGDIRPALRRMIEQEFRRSATLPVITFPDDGADTPDTPKLTLVVAPPEREWIGDAAQRRLFATWLTLRGTARRLYPAALVWCVPRPGRALRDKAATWLAWQRVARDLNDGVLGSDIDPRERTDVAARVREAEGAVRDEIWATYRYVVLFDPQDADQVRVIDLGAGHASGGDTLCARTIVALRSEALVNDSIGAGYLERNWPPALRDAGAWPLTGLRQSFLNGALTRLLDPDAVLRAKIVEFVSRGEFGLASGERPDGGFERVWFAEPISPDEVVAAPGVFLLLPTRASALKAQTVRASVPAPAALPFTPAVPEEPVAPDAARDVASSPVAVASTLAPSPARTRAIRLTGAIPSEAWNRLGTRLIAKLRTGEDVHIRVDIRAVFPAGIADSVIAELRQTLDELGLGGMIEMT